MSRSAAACLTLLVLLALAGTAPQAAEVSAAPVLIVDMRAALMPVAADHLDRALSEAAVQQAQLVLVELDTPGGLVTTVRRMVQAMLDSPVPVAVFVGPSGAEAASGGVFLVLAADIALMAPVADMGAAHPVIPTGENNPEDVGLTKAMNELAAFVRSLAEHRGIDPAVAESMVRESRSFSAREALEAGFVAGLVEDREAALAWMDGRSMSRRGQDMGTLDLAMAPRQIFQRNAQERVLGVLSQPLIAFFLLALGLLGIYAEITNPGTLLPAAVGIICLLLFALASQVLPVNWVGVGLIGLGLGLLILELKVVSYGGLTVGGLGCLVVGGLMVFDVPPELGVPRGLLASISLAVGLIAVFLLRLAIKAQRLPPATGVEALVGMQGEALTEVSASGKVLVRGEYYDARADVTVPQGSDIVVEAVVGRRLKVRAGTPEGG